MGAEGKQSKYVFKGDVNADELNKFLEGVAAGTVDRWFKSEAVPDEPLDEGIEVLVGSNFKEAVEDYESDIMVEFYAPWCGHCKKFKPEYEKLSRKLKRYFKKKPIRL